MIVEIGVYYRKDNNTKIAAVCSLKTMYTYLSTQICQNSPVPKIARTSGKPRNATGRKREEDAKRQKWGKSVKRRVINVPPSAEVTLPPMVMVTVFVLATLLIMAMAIAVALVTL